MPKVLNTQHSMEPNFILTHFRSKALTMMHMAAIQVNFPRTESKLMNMRTDKMKVLIAVVSTSMDKIGGNLQPDRHTSMNYTSKIISVWRIRINRAKNNRCSNNNIIAR